MITCCSTRGDIAPTDRFSRFNFGPKIWRTWPSIGSTKLPSNSSTSKVTFRCDIQTDQTVKPESSILSNSPPAPVESKQIPTRLRKSQSLEIPTNFAISPEWLSDTFVSRVSIALETLIVAIQDRRCILIWSSSQSILIPAIRPQPEPSQRRLSDRVRIWSLGRLFCFGGLRKRLKHKTALKGR